MAASYTGENAGVRYARPSGEGLVKATETLSSFITKAAELKYNTYRENAKEFQKNASITPEFVLSKSARDNTAKLINEYNRTWGTLFAKQASRGGLTEQQKMDMATAKAVIIEQNQNDVATMQRYQSMKQAVITNPTKYDTDEFIRYENQYINEGRFDLVTPPIKSISPDLYWNKAQNKVNSRESLIIRPVIVNGTTLLQSETASGTEEEGRTNVEQSMLGDDALRKGMIERFDTLPESEKLKYLDVNPKDNKISAEEAKDINPILNWAQDTYWHQALKWDTTKPTGIPGATKSATANQSVLKIGSGNPVKYEAPIPQSAIFAGKNYDNFYLMPEWPNQKVSVKGITVLRQTGELDKDVTGILDLSLAGYIKDTDMFVFVSNSNYRSGKYGKGDQIAVKRADVPQYSDFEIIVNGKRVKVGDLKQEDVSTAGKRKVYNTKTGQWEYQ